VIPVSDIFAAALCRQDPDGWFPDPGHKDQTATACARCTACPALAACREYAESFLARDVRLFGVWAGRFYPAGKKEKAKRPARYRRVAPCIDCGRMVRPRSQRLHDAPGTIEYGGPGPRCGTCYKRRKQNVPARPKEGSLSCLSTM